MGLIIEMALSFLNPETHPQTKYPFSNSSLNP
jgi:hypothetical protein